MQARSICAKPFENQGALKYERLSRRPAPFDDRDSVRMPGKGRAAGGARMHPSSARAGRPSGAGGHKEGASGSAGQRQRCQSARDVVASVTRLSHRLFAALQGDRIPHGWAAFEPSHVLHRLAGFYPLMRHINCTGCMGSCSGRGSGRAACTAREQSLRAPDRMRFGVARRAMITCRNRAARSAMLFKLVVAASV